MAIIIRVNGEIEKAVKVPKEKSLKFLQNVVGGYIEMVATKDGDIMVLNEEGKLIGLEVNKKATDLYIHGRIDPIVGDVLIAKPEEV